MDESSDDEDDQGETIRVVPSYTPKVVGASNPSAARVIDPISGKSLPVADMPEHMRIQLLDPKWAEERKKFQEKQKDSNLVSGDAIVANISRLVQGGAGPTGFAASRPNDPKRTLEEGDQMMATTKGRAAYPSSDPTVPTLGVAPMPPKASGAEPFPKRPRTGEPPPFKVTRAPPPPPISTGVTINIMSDNPSGASYTDPSGDPMSHAGLDPEGASTSVEERKLLSEKDFVATLEKAEVTVQIRIPNDPTQMAWNFYGQMISITVNVMSAVKDVKAELSKNHLNGLPPNKILLKDPNGGYLSNTKTLAALNVGPTATLDLQMKRRGGRN
jgi:splicing factor 3A subunit 1